MKDKRAMLWKSLIQQANRLENEAEQLRQEVHVGKAIRLENQARYLRHAARELGIRRRRESHA